ncbi:hypothetical protein J2T13_005363 [Paenibacillus sp. DS2015]|uniref:hypothetical protein n=1 Tax=Paenibacillus sp. DS2015 TaxID=3373917 RepID=UPI003D1DCAF4
MDYDRGIIYTTSLQGELLQSASLSDGMEIFLMQKLYKDDTNKVWLYYDNNSYPISDSNIDVQARIAGFYDANTAPLTISKNRDSASVLLNGNKIDISSNELLGSIGVLNTDTNKNLYLDVFEQIDSSKVLGEYTVKKYGSVNSFV